MFSLSACVLRGVTKRMRSLNKFKTGENRVVKLRTMNTTTSKNCNNTPVYSMRVNGCCADLYKKWYDYDINKKKPLNGLSMDVVYVDTMPSASPDVPVIVGLHGIGGSHRTFTSLLTHLEHISHKETPVRVVLLNFPGWGLTECVTKKVFEHSEEERIAFVKDFLKAINVKKVRVVVTHDMGFYVALGLYEQSDRGSIESFAFINPHGLETLFRHSSTDDLDLKPFLLNHLLLKAIDFPFVRSLAHKVLTKRDVNLNVKTKQIKLTLKHMLDVDYEKVMTLLMMLRLQQFPLFVAVGNDTTVQRDESRKLIDVFHLSEDSISKYAETISTASDRYPKGLIFDKGGHFLTNSHPETLAKEILNLSSHIGRKRVVISSRNDVVHL